MALVDDDHQDADLPERSKAALRWADRCISAPEAPDAAEAAAMRQHFSDDEIVEMTLAAGLFVGFSKLLIVFGLEPELMETTVLPTPSAPAA